MRRRDDDRSTSIRLGLLGACLASLLAAGCESSTPADTDAGDASGERSQTVDGPVLPDAPRTDGPAPDLPADAATDADACVAAPIDCNKRCGKLYDACGAQHACGGCEEGWVCNLDTNQCAVPLVSCADLLAECGTLRNSCGTQLDCGHCEPGQECDPDTNTCVPCSNVSCADLGRGCGMSWLGCGPPANLTDCGSCPGGQVCNEAFSVCEPDCAPASAVDICAAAASARAVECGLISDGCGGLVDCGDCPQGQACGVQGVANRCSKPPPPLECAVLGRECGPLTSACGGTLDCGDCAAGEVCSPNGVCGPPCTAKTCGDYPGQCGKQLDDGCAGKIDCGCTGGLTCDSTVAGVPGTCQPLKICDDYGALGRPGDPCSNDPSTRFPRGDGKSLSCPCQDAGVCVAGGQVVGSGQWGTCCVNQNQCASGGSCTVQDSCTGETLSCCGPNEFCDATSNTCVGFAGCTDVGASGAPGASCSNGPAFDSGNGVLVACGCSGSGVCVSGGALVTGSDKGTCCAPTECTPMSGCQVPDGCIAGAFRDCCTADEYCDNGVCRRYQSCASFSGCSNGPAFDRGDGTLVSCPCGGRAVCVNNGVVVSGAQTGSCCTPDACPGNTCSIANSCVPGQTINCCGASEYCDEGTCRALKTCGDYPNQCGTFPRGDGQTITCACSDGDVCLVGGTCCTPTACPASGPKPCSISDGCGGTRSCCDPQTEFCEGGSCRPFKTCSEIAGCSNGAAFDRGDGVKISCPCTSPAVCVNAGVVVSGSSTGVCCTPGSCAGTDACTVPHGCIAAAQPFQCCTAGEFCNSSSKCEDKKDCGDYTTGAVGQSCSTTPTFPVGDGTFLTCPCSTGGGWAKNTCTTGTCSCTPTSSCGGDCRLNSQSDGCGGTLSCPCTGGQVCNPQSGSCCTPKTCATVGGACGTVSDGCGGTISCGCSSPLICNTQTSSCCLPKTCADVGDNCGWVSDGCGRSINCGCPAPQICHNNVCCTAKTCADYPGQCGALSDGCGGTLSCGCSGGQVCNPQTSSCCTPTACGGTTGSACGSAVPNGCGGTMSCGCTPPASCGAVSAGVCGCAALTCAQVGNACGSLSDNCGGTISCGCTPPAVCYGGSCCTPISEAEACLNKTGVQSRGCGLTVNCGG